MNLTLSMYVRVGPAVMSIRMVVTEYASGVCREGYRRLLRVFAKADGSWDLTVDSKQDFASSTASDTITLAVSADVYGTGLYGTAIYGGDAIIIGRIHLELRKSFFQFTFSNSNANEPFTIFGWEIFVEPTDRI